MSDIKELFDMVTKQTEPDLGSWKEQEDRQRRRSRNRKVGAFAMVAGIVALAGIALVTMQGDDTGGTPPANSTDASAPDVTPTTAWYLDIATGERTPATAGIVADGEVSPDGTRYVYSDCCSETSDIYVGDLDGSDTVAVTSEQMNGFVPVWLDDDTILFQGRDASTFEIGDLYTANVTTGDLTMVIDLPEMRKGAWVVRTDVSPDGTTVLYQLARGKGQEVTWDLWTASIAGGDPTLVREDAGFAQYAADGSIVFMDHPYPFGGDEIWVMDGDGENVRRLVVGSDLGWPVVSPDGTTVAYGIGGFADVVDIESGDITRLNVTTNNYAWFGNDTLIVD